MKKIKLILILILFSYSAFSQVSYRVTFDSKDLTIEKKDGFDVIKMKSLKNSAEKGAPSLPMKGIKLIVPTGTDVENILINKKTTKAIEGKFLVSSQAFDKDGNIKNVQPDLNIYSSDKPYPENFINSAGAGYFDGATRIANISLCPFQYTPKTGSLEMITEIDFTLQMKPTKDEALRVKRRMKCDQEMIDNILPTLVDNQSDIGKYQVRPLNLVDDLRIPNKDTKGNNKNKVCYDNIEGNYLIITSNSLSSYFSSFITHKSGRNIIAQVFPMNIVLAMQGGGDRINGTLSINDNAGNLRQFLKNAFTLGVRYVLLAGDHTVVPVRYGWFEPYFEDPYRGPADNYSNDSHTSSYCTADLYYSELNSNWNIDGDSYYGEPIQHIYITGGTELDPTRQTDYHDGVNDFYPELYVGRIPFTNGTEITNWVNKVINYETLPPAGNRAFISKVLMTCADEMNGDDTEEPNYFPNGFTRTVYRELPYWNSLNPTAPTGAEIISELNNGYGYWSIHTHGSQIGIAVRTKGANDTGYRVKRGIFAYDNYDNLGTGWDYYYDP